MWHYDPILFFLLKSKRRPRNPGGHMSGITSRLARGVPVSKTEDVGNLCMCEVIRKRRRTKGEVIFMLKGNGGMKKEKG
jgi:hypothetical protein